MNLRVLLSLILFFAISAFADESLQSQIGQIHSYEFPLHSLSAALKSLEPDHGPQTRSIRDAALFKSIAPSVVLIVTDDVSGKGRSIGSGTLINKNGEILTNAHVVGSNKEVAVIFKPATDTQKISESDIRRGIVVRVDQIADLALVKVTNVPIGRVPTKFGDDSDISIGVDVHAIGHPQGEAWTYTKGVISQYRNDYTWDDGNFKHHADVIQTQTPINPGNSGGPLLNSKGMLIGVNTFKTRESEGINFAVSVDNVKLFLSSSNNKYAEASSAANVSSANTQKCEAKETSRGQSDDKKGDVIYYDSSCTGKTDGSITTPYDQTAPILMELDRNGDGKVDVRFFSFKRNLKWDVSYWDTNYDGTWDMVGFHPDGEILPSSYEPYATFQARLKDK